MHIEDDLSPEADRWLDEVGDEFNRKQATLQEEWLHQFYRWEFDPTTGELTLFHGDGSLTVIPARRSPKRTGAP